MDVSPVVAIQLVAISIGMLVLVAGTVFFFARAEQAKFVTRKISSLATLLAMLGIFGALSSSYYFERQDSFFASLACEADRKYAPTIVTCFNLSSGFDDADWLVNGEPRPGLDEVLEFSAAEPGSYQVELTVKQPGFLSTNSASSGELVVVGAREAFEREISETHRLFFRETGTRVFTLSAPSGFEVDPQSVVVKLERHRGELEIVERDITNAGVTVRVFGRSRIKVDFLKVRGDPSEGTLILAFTARRSPFD